MDHGSQRLRLAELQALDGDALRDALARLAERGAARRTPLPFLLAQSLGARLDGLAPEVATLLRLRMAAAMVECEAGLEARRPARGLPPRAAGRASSPLAALNAHIAQAAARRAQPGAETELASAARFRQSLARQQALARTEQAQARKPRNAGPLNSHAIALECLSLMRELAPAYLQRFIEQVEALQLLEQWQSQAAAKTETRAEAAGGRRKRAGSQAPSPLQGDPGMAAPRKRAAAARTGARGRGKAG